MNINFYVRDRDEEDFRRIAEKIKAQDKTVSGVIMQMLRRWEREHDRTRLERREQ
jgi:hypothetical protein